MSNSYYRHMSLGGIDTSNLPTTDLQSLLRRILEAKIHGISFSPYVEGQGPGTQLDQAQVSER